MTHPIDTAIDALLCDPDGLATLAVAASRPSPVHLDDDGLAAILDGEGAATDLMHAIGCAECRARLDALHRILSIRDIGPTTDEHPLWLGTRVVLVATVSTTAAGDAVVETSGAARVHGALAVRANRGLAGLSLRDCRDDPSLEVSIVPGGRPATFNLLVRWLAASGRQVAARVSSGGRIRAHMALTGGSAFFAGLRRESVRIDVVDGDRRLATAWIGVTP